MIEFNREWQLREKEVIGLEQQLEELQLEAMKRDGQDIQAEQAEQDIQACEEAVCLLHEAQQVSLVPSEPRYVTYSIPYSS